jgi:hypothetical protein
MDFPILIATSSLADSPLWNIHTHISSEPQATKSLSVVSLTLEHKVRKVIKKILNIISTEFIMEKSKKMNLEWQMRNFTAMCNETSFMSQR